MPLEVLTIAHVLISLVGIASGCYVTYMLLQGARSPHWNAVFLITTILTSATGYLFPFTELLPSHIVGAISLVVLAIASIAYYPRRLAGSWRTVYVITAMTALYLNLFVLVVQAFLKIPLLQAMAPTQTEPPFAIAQLILLAGFIWLTFRASMRFRQVRPASA